MAVVLGIEPFYGGSHRAFLDSLCEASKHDWHLLTAPAVHWKWRMRSAPLALASEANEWAALNGIPDLVLCSDMLDLPVWLAAVGRQNPSLNWHTVPTVTYFHESQWKYPIAPHARVDFHYGYTNLLTAMLSDACWFNSHFHRSEFLAESRSFVRNMPDNKQVHDFESIAKKSNVLPPGFRRVSESDRPTQQSDSHAINLGWVSRWEYDKRPDVFLQLLRLLKQRQIDFRLTLLGPRKNSVHLATIVDEFGAQIDFNAYAPNRREYADRLANMDVVVSTADHEYFGIAICEAIAAGAVPVLPNRLSYPELVPEECLYEDLVDAAELIDRLCQPGARCRLSSLANESVSSLEHSVTLPAIDKEIDQIVS